MQDGSEKSINGVTIKSSPLQLNHPNPARSHLNVDGVSKRSQRDRAPPDQAQPSVDQRSGRANEQNDQGRDCKTLPLRNPRSAANAPRELLGNLELRPKAQDAERPHAPRIHLQNLDIRARSIHPKSDPPDAGTEHLERYHAMYRLSLKPLIACRSAMPIIPEKWTLRY